MRSNGIELGVRQIHVHGLPFGWTLVRTADLDYIDAESERRRERNVAAAAEIAALEKVRASERHLARELRRELELRREVTKRAEIAEGIARGQAKHIESLQASNHTMLQAITDMRRTGFSLPSDILNSPDPEVITTVADDDLQAVKSYPHLAAADED